MGAKLSSLQADKAGVWATAQLKGVGKCAIGVFPLCGVRATVGDYSVKGVVTQRISVPSVNPDGNANLKASSTDPTDIFSKKTGYSAEVVFSDGDFTVLVKFVKSTPKETAKMIAELFFKNKYIGKYTGYYKNGKIYFKNKPMK